MSYPKIENLEKLLQKFIDDEKTIIGTNISMLTAPGEHFGSIMYRVEATVQDEHDKKETLHVVAKCVPTEEFFKKLFNVNVTLKAEMRFYTDVVPHLQQFQREHGVQEVINCFPKFYGARLNLQEQGDLVDDHALLVLENLVVKGFRNVDRYVGFNYDDAKLILKDLATFHAVPLALRLQKPTEFDEKIRRFCIKSEDDHPLSLREEMFIEIIKDVEQCQPYLAKVEALVSNSKQATEQKPGEIFATIIHEDMWVNNTMQRFENGRAVENKFVDFQGYKYDSPVKDLIFFLWSSCQYTTLAAHLEDLIHHYYQHFVATLKSLDIDTSQYTYEKLFDEMKAFVKGEILHSVFFTTYIVFGKQKATTDPQKREINFDVTGDQVAPELKNRIALMVEYYGKLRWL